MNQNELYKRFTEKSAESLEKVAHNGLAGRGYFAQVSPSFDAAPSTDLKNQSQGLEGEVLHRLIACHQLFPTLSSAGRKPPN
jgi:hypothetical protein